jgi:hypothetical protein
MDFIVHLSSRAFLSDLLRDFNAEAKNGNIPADLSKIPFVVFVRTCAKRLQLVGFKAARLGKGVTADDVLLTLCGLFDRIDIDSMGYIAWDDFTTHVLRAGKTHLKPVTVKNASLEFKKASKTSKPLPARRMIFVDAVQRLFIFENDNPSMRIFDTAFDQIGTFKPFRGLQRMKATKDLAILPYYGKRQKERLFEIQTVDEKAVRAKAVVCVLVHQ